MLLTAGPSRCAPGNVTSQPVPTLWEESQGPKRGSGRCPVDAKQLLQVMLASPPAPLQSRSGNAWRHLPSCLHQPPNPQIHERPHLAKKGSWGAQGVEALLSACGGRGGEGSSQVSLAAVGRAGGVATCSKVPGECPLGLLDGLGRVTHCQRPSRGKRAGTRVSCHPAAHHPQLWNHQCVHRGC